MSTDHSRKTAVITGASAGIGQACAVALSKANWNLVLTARRLPLLEETASMCQNPSETVLVVAGEITDEQFVEALFSKGIQKFGRLDMLFNNAGISSMAPIESTPLSALQKVLNVNVVGPWLCTREAVKVFKAQSPQGGRIINNGSTSAHVPRPLTSSYTLSKHAITGLTKSTALDGRSFGITATQIDIGNAATSMTLGHIGQKGVLQPDGSLKLEATFDPKHVAETIVHIANLPNDVTVLEMNIMAAMAPYVGRG